jgi:hypothetical protein
MQRSDPNPEKPSEQKGGTAPGEAEAREKGPWAAKAAEGVVPDELGVHAPREADPQLGEAVTGGPARSQEPATQEGIDETAGDNADATAIGGPDAPPGAEPDLRDAAAGPRAADVESAG